MSYIPKLPNDINVGDKFVFHSVVNEKLTGKVKTLARKVVNEVANTSDFTYYNTIITNDSYSSETYIPIPADEKIIPADTTPSVIVQEMTIDTKYKVNVKDGYQIGTLVNKDILTNNNTVTPEPIFKLTFGVNPENEEPIIQTVSNADTLLVYSPPASVLSGGKQKSRRNQTKSRKSKKSRKNRKSNRRSFRETKN